MRKVSPGSAEARCGRAGGQACGQVGRRGGRARRPREAMIGGWHSLANGKRRRRAKAWPGPGGAAWAGDGDGLARAWPGLLLLLSGRRGRRPVGVWPGCLAWRLAWAPGPGDAQPGRWPGVGLGGRPGRRARGRLAVGLTTCRCLKPVGLGGGLGASGRQARGRGGRIGATGPGRAGGGPRGSPGRPPLLRSGQGGRTMMATGDPGGGD